MTPVAPRRVHGTEVSWLDFDESAGEIETETGKVQAGFSSHETRTRVGRIAGVSVADFMGFPDNIAGGV